MDEDILHMPLIDRHSFPASNPKAKFPLCVADLYVFEKGLTIGIDENAIKAPLKKAFGHNDAHPTVHMEPVP